MSDALVTIILKKCKSNNNMMSSSNGLPGVKLCRSSRARKIIQGYSEKHSPKFAQNHVFFCRLHNPNTPPHSKKASTTKKFEKVPSPTL